MLFSQTLFVLCAALAEAHYVFPSIGSSSQWQYVRQTYNHYTLAPVDTVLSPNMTCYATGNMGAETYSIAAGSTITWTSEPAVYHPGPLMAYMALVPSGETAASYDGSGKNWFKIYEDQPTTALSWEMSWPNMNQDTFSFTIPSCLCGQYLFRIEQIGLHVASTENGAQPFLACAQLDVTNSNCNDGSPAAGSPYLVEFPGAYSPTDPGLLINIYVDISAQVASYVTPGPQVWSCGAS